MDAFELNEKSLLKGWGGEDQYWFSLRTYHIKDASAFADMDKPLEISQSAYFLSHGYIPYFMVTNEEVMRAYIASTTNEKLKAAFLKLDKEKYVDTFWKYYNAYPQLAEGFESFERDYLLKKAIAWCEENSIPYVIK